MPKATLEYTEEEVLQLVEEDIRARFELEDDDEVEVLCVIDRVRGKPIVTIRVQLDSTLVDVDDEPEDT